ncbi:MAG: type II toxin-antitoxin system VapC family toxin [Aggregatilineales bacterium]
MSSQTNGKKTLTTSTTQNDQSNNPAVYVIDTNILIWWLTELDKLNARTREIFEAAKNGQAQIIISSMVIFELFYADKKWKLFDDFAQIYKDLKVQPYFQFVSLGSDDVLDFARDSAVPEMHDRIIVGVARRLGWLLLTADSQIIKAGLVPIV